MAISCPVTKLFWALMNKVKKMKIDCPIVILIILFFIYLIFQILYSSNVYFGPSTAIEAGKKLLVFMMTSLNGNIFCGTGPLCGEFTGHWWFPLTKASDADLWCFFYLRPNKRLSKQSWGWWFETPARSLWRHCINVKSNECVSWRLWLPTNLLFIRKIFQANNKQTTKTLSDYDLWISLA